jgi:hypothetical protein
MAGESSADGFPGENYTDRCKREHEELLYSFLFPQNKHHFIEITLVIVYKIFLPHLNVCKQVGCI